MKTSTGLIACCAVVLLMTSNSMSRAGEEESASDARVVYLEQKVAELESRIARLENRLSKMQSGLAGVDVTASEQNAPRDWTKPASWEMMRAGLTLDEVVQILGAPVRRDILRGSDGRFFYEGFVGESRARLRGYVHFSGGFVDSFEKPRF